MEFPSVYQSKGGKQVTNARLLYTFLGLTEGQFNRWAKLHITDNPYATEGIDYQQFDTHVELHNGGGRIVVDFALTLAFAKKLAMASNSPKGERIRDYFLACEDRLKELTKPSYMIEDPVKRAEQWIREEKQRAALQIENGELKPQAEYASQVLTSQSSLTTTTIAQELDMSAQRLNKLLADRHVQYKQSGIWNLHARYQGKGYARLSTYAHTGSDGQPRTEHLLVWTETGRQFIHSLLNPQYANRPLARTPSLPAPAERTDR